nr:unnamed protein product [Callosobruchus chinensis]
MFDDENEICSIGMTMQPSDSASSGISLLSQCGEVGQLPELPAPDEQRLQEAAELLQQPRRAFGGDFSKWSAARQALPTSKQPLDQLKADLWAEVEACWWCRCL